MSDYDFQPGGSLKLKGVIDGSVKKKKKKSSKPKEKEKVDIARSRLQENRSKDSDDGGGTSTLKDAEVPVATINKTEAEKRFEAAQRERLQKKIAKVATKTHKERVNEFNTKLEALSEHHDIPKVGPG